MTTALNYNRLDLPNTNTMILHERDNGVFSAWNYGSKTSGGKLKKKTRTNKKSRRSRKNKRRTKRI